jgi:hypothetical protein
MEARGHTIMQIVVDALNDSFKWFEFHVNSTPDCHRTSSGNTMITFVYLLADQWHPLLFACWSDKALYEEDFCFFLEKDKQTGLYIKSLAYRVVQDRRTGSSGPSWRKPGSSTISGLGWRPRRSPCILMPGAP